MTTSSARTVDMLAVTAAITVVLMLMRALTN